MKTPLKHLPLAQIKAHTLSSYGSAISPPEHLVLDGTLLRQSHPQELFTNAQLFPSMLPDDSKAMSGRSHQIEG